MSCTYSEFPYSDELFHYGVKGQKWGIRRFQNPDGTLTALGKVHYGAQKAIKGTAKYVGKTAKRAGLNFIGKHARWLMTDEALQEYTKRLTLENNYYRAMSESKKSKGKEFVGNILYKAGDKLIGAGLDNMASNIRAKNDEKLKEKAFDFQNYLDNKKKNIEEAREERKNSKKESYKFANETLDMIKNPSPDGRTLTNEQIAYRLERVNMLKSLEDLKGQKVEIPVTFKKDLGK